MHDFKVQIPEEYYLILHNKIYKILNLVQQYFLQESIHHESVFILSNLSAIPRRHFVDFLITQKYNCAYWWNVFKHTGTCFKEKNVCNWKQIAF